MKRRRTVHDSPTSMIIDAMMDRYVSWREACAAVEKTYRDWLGARSEDRAAAFAVYSAALDREEHAAMEYQRLTAEAESEVSGATTPTAAR
jgi:hypothetical protein